MHRAASLNVFPSAGCRSEASPSNPAIHRRSFEDMDKPRRKSCMSVTSLAESLEIDGLVPTTLSRRQRIRKRRDESAVTTALDGLLAECDPDGIEVSSPRGAETEDDDDTADDIERRRGSLVSFHRVEFRNFRVCVGDNPSVLRGPPLSLDWEYDPADDESLDIDEYEFNRGPRRTRDQMLITKEVRERQLREEGYSARDMRKAAEKADRVAAQRMETIRTLQLARGEEMMEVAARKLKYFVTRNSVEKEQRKLWNKAQKRAERRGSDDSRAKMHPLFTVADEFPQKPMFTDDYDEEEEGLAATMSLSDSERDEIYQPEKKEEESASMHNRCSVSSNANDEGITVVVNEITI